MCQKTINSKRLFVYSHLIFVFTVNSFTISSSCVFFSSANW